MIGFAHDAKACWNPHFHGASSSVSAKLLTAWYAREYHGKTFHDLERFAALPLCVFGGAVNSAYTCTERSLGGTYAVCRGCEGITMCGWGEDGVTKACGSCRRKFTWGDYYQPVMTGLTPSPEQLRSLIDPAKDPAVTVAELCAYLPDGIPSAKIAPLIVILAAKGLLRAGKHLDYGMFEVRKSGVESDQVREAVSSGRWTRVDPAAKEWNVHASEPGKALLKARGIQRDRAALKEIGIALCHDERRLKYEAVSKLAAVLMP